LASSEQPSSSGKHACTISGGAENNPVKVISLTTDINSKNVKTTFGIRKPLSKSKQQILCEEDICD
jgi:hypothetical protein